MAIIRCKMCGGDVDLAPDKTFGTCECCGNTMTFPKVDDDQRAAAFNRGNHFRRIGEFDKALAVYERIVREDDADAEAHWCCALCRFGIEYVEDPSTYEWLPTCHRASFDSFLEDVDYLAALEHSDGITRRQYQKDAAKIAEVQRGILATSQNAEPYDVFICYKESDPNGDRTRDSLLAQDIYYQLTEQGRKVFFARITLEDVVGSQYEPYIFAALNSAKVMIVVGTQPEYLNAVWVKNEWSRFLAMMKKDRSKLLLPCYRDMDPYDLPEQLSVLQSYDMGKIGFIQDLIRGVSKVLDAAKPQEKVSQTVVVQQAAAQSAVAPMLRRGHIALEDADWGKADEFFEDVLNHDPECVDAYIGKALAEQRCETLEHLVKRQLERTAEAPAELLMVNGNIDQGYLNECQEHINEMVQKYMIEGYYSESQIRAQYDFKKMRYPSYAKGRMQQLKKEEDFWNQNKNLSRAMKFEQEQQTNRVSAARTQVLNAMQERLDAAVQEDRESVDNAEQTMRKMVKAADEQVIKGFNESLKKLCQRLDEVLKNTSLASDVLMVKSKLEPFGEYPAAQALLDRCPGLLKKLCHAQYEQACNLMVKAKTEADYRAVKRLFVEIAEYEDSMERAKECRELEFKLQNDRISSAVGKKRQLMQEKQELEAELEGLSKLFGARRRKEIELRLEEIERSMQ